MLSLIYLKIERFKTAYLKQTSPQRANPAVTEPKSLPLQ